MMILNLKQMRNNMESSKLFNKPVFIKEEYEYSSNELKNKFNCDSKNIDRILKELSFSNIISKTNKGAYKITYVGVVIIDNIVIYCYPKYLHNYDLKNQDDFNELNNHFKEVIKVIKKYGLKNRQTVESDLFYNDSDNFLPLILYFVDDYYEKGLYENTQRITEINGSGEILWDTTINNTFPMIKNNRPYYLELHTKKRITDLNNYFRKLHQIILDEVFDILADTQLDELFGIPRIPHLSNIKREDFDDVENIIRKLDKELNIQFNTRKIKLLKAIKKYLEKESSSGLFDNINLYGVRKYEYVWEDVCKTVFDDMLNETMTNLPIELNPKFYKYRNNKLSELIEHPIWYIEGEKNKKDTYIIDLITIYEDNFLIFDAKYYDVEISKKEINGQPGIESITKQYMYQLTYKDFYKAHELNVFNSFLFPIDGENSIKGYAILEMLNKFELEPIKAIFVSAKEIYECYLKNSSKYKEEFRKKIFELLLEYD